MAMPDPVTPDPLESLRTILVGPEQEQLRKLDERVSDISSRANDVSEVLPRAIGIRASRDKTLQVVIQPVLEEVLRVSVQKNPRILADALFPIIGAAIRKSLAAALETMMQSLTQLQEQSLSARGIGWRLEALRTGKTFGEIVLLQSLLYRVEQVFLIHRETGLLLCHREASGVVSKDADMVSAMLTAINDFVGDSFGTSGVDTRELDQIKVGELTVWIQHGPQALLAGVVQGAAPRELSNVLGEAIEEVHQKFSPQLAAFKGDASAFQQSVPALDRCLLGKGEDLASGRRSTAMTAVSFLIPAAILIWLGYGWWRHHQWDNYVDRLRAEPGVVLTESRYRDVAGLRDPLSRDPGEMLRESGIDAAQVRAKWEPYHSLDPRFVSIRRRNIARETIERQRFLFETNRTELGAQHSGTLALAAAAIGEYLALAGPKAAILVTGHADSIGGEGANRRIAMERARGVVDALVNLGVPADRLRASEPVGYNGRAVTFRIVDGSAER